MKWRVTKGHCQICNETTWRIHNARYTDFGCRATQREAFLYALRKAWVNG